MNNPLSKFMRVFVTQIRFMEFQGSTKNKFLIRPFWGRDLTR